MVLNYVFKVDNVFRCDGTGLNVKASSLRKMLTLETDVTKEGGVKLHFSRRRNTREGTTTGPESGRDHLQGL